VLILRPQSNISFHLYQDSNIRTLSTNTADDGDTLEGLLYVPDLDRSDPCRNISRPYVTHNTTRQSNLPPTDYSLIALAPWISANCTLSYLAAARADPARAFVFFPTDNSTDQPPPMNDPMWGLHDGGAWKSQNKYPVYAVPGQTGALLMHHLGKYSGNMTDVENGHLLTEMYDSRDYVRLYTVITTGSSTSLPSLWVFLLIILSILLLIIAVTSLLMHYIQRRHRQTLQRRVATGEVDLEALGIKRLTVPQEVIDRMPLFVYVAMDEELPQRDKPPSPTQSYPVPPNPTSPLTAPFPTSPTLPSATVANPATTYPIPASQSHPIETSSAPTTTTRQSKHTNHQLPFSQPSCPICLEDFTSHSTAVRELPCAHIFHPECVDIFLRNSSSLCPMCKKSVLPKGYCPTNITNAMVRRERLLSRMRERVTVEVVDTGTGPAARPSPVPAQRQRPGVMRQRMPSFHRQFGRAARARAGPDANANANVWRTSGMPPPPPPDATTVEMVQASAGTPTHTSAPTRTVSTTDRVRHRTAAILNTQPMTAGDEDRARQASPRCTFSAPFSHPSSLSFTPTSKIRLDPSRFRFSRSGVELTLGTGRRAIESVFPGFR